MDGFTKTYWYNVALYYLVLAVLLGWGWLIGRSEGVWMVLTLLSIGSIIYVGHALGMEFARGYKKGPDFQKTIKD